MNRLVALLVRPFGPEPIRQLAVALLAGMLASCGGGGSGGGDSPPTADAQSPTKKAQATFVPTTPIPADANVKGMFSPVYNWPLIPLHAVLMPDGRILSYGTNGDGTQTGKFIYDVWDPEGGLAGGHLTLPNNTPTDLFCSTQIVLPLGDQVFLGGGDNWNTTVPNNTNNLGNNNSNTFTLASNALTPGPNMNRPRWYATSTTLVNGEILVAGGIGGTDSWEVRGADGNFRLLNTQSYWIDYYYPRNFVRPDGKVVGIGGNGVIYNVDPTGPGSATWLANLPAPYFATDTSVVMYRPGKLIQFGGDSNGSVTIDIRSAEVGGAAPTIAAAAPLSSQRRLVTGTLLADGKVLATGGSAVWNEMVGVNYNAETWNPVTGQWDVGAAYNRARLYHNVALLLPDGTVMVGGGGAPGPQNNTNFELYYPPYLFAANGTLAARPTITTAPTVLNIGKGFTMQVGGSGSVSRVVLVKTGSVTHGNNMDQRFVELPFSTVGDTLTVQPPSRAGEATPGFYMLFVLNAEGVPSVSKVVRMNIGGADAANAPVLAAVADRNGAVGAAVNLQLAATDPNGNALTYSAGGLPPGLALNAATGAITGTIAGGGTFHVSVAASDGVNNGTQTFTWTVSGVAALTVNIPVLPTAQVSGAAASFTAATQNAVNPRYKWDFGDGTPETAYSASPTATHTYTAGGRYFVTVTAIDDRNIEQRQTVMQTIYLPATAQKPSASTNIVLQQPAAGNARLWVVNQDNDSVSVFDSVTRAKLAEVVVGTAPRSVAVAPNGMVWVSNKQSASISVIDPNNFTISRTLALPRASLPFGVAIAPTGGFALVVLEGTGQVLKFDTATYAQIGTALSVGTNPRHVSINSPGTTAYVSRFVSPALPGEATATVTTTGAGVGGQVLRVNTGAMTLASTIALAHSDRADAENQGRGVPNYLGAAAISPDGTQAWVPSKQDNIKRGGLRDGLTLNFQNTVRAISSRITLANNLEVPAARIDHDNASMASAAAYDPRGNYLFVALETSREVAVVDAYAGIELFRIEAGLAPQGVVVSADGNTLFVHNFMARTVSVFDLTGLMTQGLGNLPLLATVNTVAAEKLAANVLKGKQFFYDAADTRLARDRYLSCASCHNDGGSDGRVWDFTGMGEGLRNTVQLRGRAGMGHGLLHWSGNFNEVQDFEGQIRTLSGGTGLMTDAQYNTGTRNQPLGDAKAGVSADLDALAAYVTSLNQFELSPLRNADGSLSTSGAAGATVFTASCASCHAGSAFTDSVSRNIGTIKQPTSGTRLGAPLTGIDTPTLRDVWATAPYLHDGSAATVEAAIQAHGGLTLSAADLANVASYVRQIGREEAGSAVTPTQVRHVRLEAVTEVNGNPWTTMAEFNLLDSTGAVVPRAGWLVSADSAEDDSPATNAIDGTNTIWHTQWKTATPLPPHTFTVNLGAVVNVGGFRYLPPQGANNNGQIATYRFYTSADGVNWALVSSGSFANTIAEKTVLLGAAPNQAPTLAAVANQTSVVGTAATLALSATDPDGDVLTYSATGLPAGLAVNAATGVIGGTPTTAGVYIVTAQVSDSKGGLSPSNFTWTVNAAGASGTRYVRLEALTEVNGNPWTTMAEFNLLDATGATVPRTGWQVSADSAEDDSPATNAIDGAPTIWHTQWKTANPLPPHTFTVNLGAVVNVGGFRYLPPQGANNNGQIANWRFQTSPDGVVWTVVGTGTFANTIAEKTVTFTAMANQAPTLAVVANQAGVVGTAATLALSATDPDGDVLSYSATGLPTGLAISATTGAIGGTPTAAGTYAVTAQASDGRGGAAARSFTWTITAAPPVNQAPTLAAVANQTGVVGTAATLTLSATDPNGDVLTYSATGLPAGLAVNAGTGVIGGTPTTAGVFSVTAQASDGKGGVSARSFTWTVSAAPTVGTGLTGSYFNNITLTGTPVLTRVEAVNFTWGSGSPGTGVNANNFSARWTGSVAAATTGAYRFRTVSDNGVRLWVNGVQIVNNWTSHTSATDTSAVVNLTAGQRYTITLEYYDGTGTATMQLRWLRPGTTTYVAIPATSLYAN